MTPRCFDSDEQYILWLDANKQMSRSMTATSMSHCEDCCPSFALKMREQGRCDHPEITFRCGGGIITVSCEREYTSKYKHVCWHKARKKWTAYAFKDATRTTIGYFDTEELAHQARVQWVLNQQEVAA